MTVMTMAHEEFAPAGRRTSTLWDTLKTLWRRRHRRAYLDVRTLPEYLQRDIGILDGNRINWEKLERTWE
jgi:hypothetical protein